ncbi:MAG: hypothetical protein PVH61_04280 [Candidatus Aminicenantes bacterium]|jgi:hypothetical protein
MSKTPEVAKKELENAVSIVQSFVNDPEGFFGGADKATVLKSKADFGVVGGCGCGCLGPLKIQMEF